jgi:hypothetical protein
MRRIGFGLTAVVVLGVVCLASTARADEENIPLDKVPKPVIDTAKKRFPGAELTGALKVTEKDKTRYEIQLQHKGNKYAVQASEAGKLMQIEKEIPVKDLPAAVTDALEAKYPKASIKTAEELTKVIDGKEKMTGYTIGLAQKDKTFEVVVTPDGKISKAED